MIGDLGLVEISYLAGIVDGEGYFHASIGSSKPTIIRRINRRFTLTLNIGNTSIELMQWLTATFGGGVVRIKPISVNHRVGYTWRVWGDLAFAITMLIKPYLIIKKKEAEIFLELSKTRINPKGGASGCHGFLDGVWEQRKELIQELKNVRKYRDPSTSNSE